MPSGHTKARFLDITITGAGVKDVRVYPVPLDETALNAEFDATVALITAWCGPRMAPSDQHRGHAR